MAHKILVTGASGFVGPHLVRELSRAGHSVLCVDRRGNGGCTILDLSDHQQVGRFLDEHAPDCVIHLAGFSHVGHSWEQTVEVFESNLNNSIALYKHLGRVTGRRGRFVYVSSSTVYGSAPAKLLPLKEDCPTAPDSPYAMSKLAGEMTLNLLRKHGGPELLVVRPFNLIGPGQSAQFACPSFARQIAEIEAGEAKVLRHGNLTSKRDFLDVRDAARAYRLIVEEGEDGEVFNLSSGTPHSMQSIVERLFALADLTPSLELVPSLMRPADTPELYGSSDYLRRRTGWKPLFTLDETLQTILDEARERIAQGVR